MSKNTTKSFSHNDYQTDCASVNGLKTPDETQSLDNTVYKGIDTYLEQQMRRLHLPGVALAIVEGDRMVHLHGFGKARPSREVPTPQTPFFIGSLTKSFTALAVMQLVEAGKLELDGPIQRYLPWFRVANPEASAQITVRHLLNQTSGLPTLSGEVVLADFDACPDATKRQAQALATLKLTRPVGTAFEYSNMNYNLLGLIIEAASGQKYADYIQNHILNPLNMNHTYTSPAEAKQHDLAIGHRYWFGFPVAAPDLPVPPGSLPAGLLISTSEDLAHYLISFLNQGCYEGRQILSSAGITELHHGVADFRAMGLALGQYAMGWFVDKIGCTKLVWHGGTLPHFGAFMALLPEQNKGVVLLFNACHHWMNPVLTEVGMGVTALLAGEPPAPARFMNLIPWLLRSQLFIPVLQIISIATTLRRFRHWHKGSSSGSKMHLLFSLLPNLLFSLIILLPVLGKRRGYLKLYMPDFYWVGLGCGSFSLGWSFLQVGLVLKALRNSPSSPGSFGHPAARRSAFKPDGVRSS